MDEYLKWIGGGIAGIFAAILGSKLLTAVFKRRWDGIDRRGLAEKAAAEKSIDADVNAFNSIFKRLETVEQRLDAAEKELADQRVENAKLETINEQMSKENERQEKEIERQRDKVHSLAGNIQQKELQIVELNSALKRGQIEAEALRSELHETTMNLNRLRLDVEKIQAGEKVARELTSGVDAEDNGSDVL